MTALIAMCGGGAAAASMVSLLLCRLSSPRRVIAFNSAACALFAALTAFAPSGSVLTALAAGFLTAAAPLTSVVRRQSAIETVPEAIHFAARVGVLMALSLLYGAAFAMIGFLAALFVAAPVPH